MEEVTRARLAHTYDYAIIRVVPRVEREEFVNVGVIVRAPPTASWARRGTWMNATDST